MSEGGIEYAEDRAPVIDVTDEFGCRAQVHRHHATQSRKVLLEESQLVDHESVVLLCRFIEGINHGLVQPPHFNEMGAYLGAPSAEESTVLGSAHGIAPKHADGTAMEGPPPQSGNGYQKRVEVILLNGLGHRRIPGHPIKRDLRLVTRSFATFHPAIGNELLATSVVPQRKIVEPDLADPLSLWRPW